MRMLVWALMLLMMMTTGEVFGSSNVGVKIKECRRDKNSAATTNSIDIVMVGITITTSMLLVRTIHL